MLASSPMQFDFNGHGVRVITNNQNQIFFVATDVCNILGYNNTSKAISDNCKAPGITSSYIGVQTGTKKDGTPAIQQMEYTIINEGNLYRLVMRSKMKDAERFQDWVCDEVLPQIRKTGKYGTKTNEPIDFTDPENILQLAQNWADEAKKRKEAELLAERLQITTDLQEKELKKAAPKVDFYEKVMQSDSLIATTVIAKELGWSAERLNHELCLRGIIWRVNGVWVITAKYASMGYTGTKTTHYTSHDGSQKTAIHTYWTQKGREFIHRTFGIKVSNLKMA